MALNAYIAQTRRLLNDENSQFYSDSDLTAYINNGRDDIAKRTECLIAGGTLVAAPSTQSFSVASLTPPDGYLAPQSIRSISVTNNDTSLTLLENRNWQWFQNYYMSGPASIATGKTTVWAQRVQGVSGTIFIYPITDASYTLVVESAWAPAPLVNDSTTEVLAYPWIDAVPFFGAYQAYLQAQRQTDADRLYKQYEMYIESARLGVTPMRLGSNYPAPKGGAMPSGPSINQNASPPALSEGKIA